jgi:hypothetical protein
MGLWLLASAQFVERFRFEGGDRLRRVVEGERCVSTSSHRRKTGGIVGS